MKNLKVIFMGTPEFSAPVLQKLIDNTNVVLVVTQPDKLVGRKRILTKSPIKILAENNNIPVITPKKIRVDFKEIINTPADIIITCAYGQIIPEELLSYPPLGCINVHASLLPKYRGGAPIHWALINGEDKTGITIMYMDKKMDNGDIIAQMEYQIKPSDNVGTLHEELSKIGAKLLIETLPSILDKTNNRLKQNEEEVTYAYNITRSDEELDFNDKGINIINKIRGLNPWPLANFKMNNMEIKVINAHFVSCKVNEIGKIEVDKNNFGVTCQDGIIYLDKIKPFGKKEMNIKDFINGIKQCDYQNKNIKD